MIIHSKIKDAIAEDKLIFFIGAGLSTEIGYPSWKNLVLSIVKNLKEDYPNNSWLTAIPNLLSDNKITELVSLDYLKEDFGKNRIIEEVNHLLNIEIDSNKLDKHKKIWSITNKIITTNFDLLFESVKPKEAEVIIYDDRYKIANFSLKKSFLYKIHGSIERQHECLLFTEQYQKLYKSQHGAIKRLFDVLTDSTIIFLGFSLNDPYVKELLKLRAKIFHGLMPNHYIITKDNKNDFKHYGIESIQVNNYGDDVNEFLTNLIEEKKKTIK